MQNNIKILMLGDVIGKTGRLLLERHLPAIRKENNIDAVIVNGENSADGKGITPKIMDFYKSLDISMVTTGNHIWQKKDIYPYFITHKDLLRPANFPSSCPGTGVGSFLCKDFVIGVINVQGRTFMKEQLSCPFRAADTAISFLKSKTNIILVDFHAEASSEKNGMAYYLDGRVSAVVGTHTHIQTADERVLPGGTAYITDLGMSGSLNSMIGLKKNP